MWKAYALKHILGSHGNITANDIQADTFNEYFTDIGRNIADQSDNTTYSFSLPRNYSHIWTFLPWTQSYCALLLVPYPYAMF